MSALDEAVAIVHAAERRDVQRGPSCLLESGMLSVLGVRRGAGPVTTLRCRFDYESPQGASSLQFTLLASFAERVLHAREASGRLFPHVRVALDLTADNEWNVRYLTVLER